MPSGSKNFAKNSRTPNTKHQQVEPRSFIKAFYYKNKQIKILGTASFIVLLGSGLMYYIIILSLAKNLDLNNDLSTDSFPFIPGKGEHYLIPKSGWNGNPPLTGTKPLSHPIPMVIIIHTATPPCESFAKCKARMESMQSYHVNHLHFLDVAYNFVIGGDENIYEGRGWDIMNDSRNNSVGIAFVGNYVFDKLTPGMIEAAKNLIAEGVRLEKISKDYLLVCHNQTKNTLSPGENVYREVQKWPHFKPIIVS